MATGRLPDPNSAPVTAKGDLYTYSTVPAKLAVGNNGETLVADSSATTGLRWQSGDNANLVINGGFDIWQRGTSFIDLSPSYTADRWWGFRASNVAGLTITRQSASLDSFRYCYRLQRTSGNTSTNGLRMSYGFETSDVIPLQGKAVVLSFYARAGANYSGGTLEGTLALGTGTDEAPSGPPTNGTNVATTNATLTTSWQRFTATGTVGTDRTDGRIVFAWTPTGTAGAADYVEITGVQLELGTVPTNFKRAGGTLAGELAACQRYYYLHASGDQKFIGNDTYYATTSLWVPVQFPVTMRGTPTLSASSGTNYYRSDTAGASDFFNSFTIYLPSTTGAFIYNNSEAAGTAGNSGLVFSNNAAASVAFSAEL